MLAGRLGVYVAGIWMDQPRSRRSHRCRQLLAQHSGHEAHEQRNCYKRDVLWQGRDN